MSFDLGQLPTRGDLDRALSRLEVALYTLAFMIAIATVAAIVLAVEVLG